ncbi:MAG: glycosyl transferase family 1 [Enterovirga sp.]|nr:glycosyl transferase family 1 [Enterovirga sp.]
MRVVIIADFADAGGGAQSVAIQSAVALAAAGTPVTYIHAVDGPVDPRLGQSGIAHQGLGQPDVWDRPALAGAVAGIWNRDAAKRLGAVLGSLPAGDTVLHLHQWTRAFSPAIFPVLLRSPHPLAVTLHDYFMACPNGVYYRFDRGEPCRLTPLSAGCIVAPCDPRSAAHKAIRVLRALATRFATAGRAFDVVHVSDRGAETLAPFLPGSLRQHRIPNPVAAERGPSAEVAQDGKIAFIGRLTREKGADLVAAAGRAAGVPTMFIGEGPAADEILRIDPGAELLGWRSGDEVAALLRQRVLAVAAPSRWYETGPLTVYEAMAAGVPVVVSARAGAAETVRHGETGLVVEPELGPLTAAFGEISQPGRAARLGRAAHERYWEAPLSAQMHAGRLLALYGGMLGAAPALSQA